ncbi:MAG TPA: sulfite exporter TauE/SafE family protein [Mycobacteriales bacterium]
MEITDAALLLGAGLVAGAVNAVAGGGSLITFPSLVATGLSPVVANVTNALAVCPGYVASVAGSRHDLTGQRTRAVRLAPAAIVGALGGAALLLLTPARAFALIVPFLVLAAAGLLAFQPRLQRVVGHPAHISPRRRQVTLQLLTLLGAVYGGYFGGALGVILVAVLALVLDEPLRRVSAMKNVLSAIVGVTGVLTFALFGPVHWTSVAVLAPATLIGGYVGARVARRLPQGVLRWSIVAFGVGVGIVLLVRAR